MCLLIWQGPGAELPEPHIRNGWANNPDGGGYAFIDDDNRIQVRKFMKLTDFLTNYEIDHRKFGEWSPFLVHFRFGTHGGNGLDNTHPFWLGKNKQTVVAHNGVLDVLMDYSDDKSDTRVFVDEYLSRLPVNWLDDEYLTDLVEDFIIGSKLVILTVNPMHQYDSYILREKDGEWNKDGTIWYSNSTYKRSTYRVLGSSKNYGKVMSLTDKWSDEEKGKDKAPLDSGTGIETEEDQCPVCYSWAYYDVEYECCWDCECCALCYGALEHCECWDLKLDQAVGREMESQYVSIHNMTDDEVAYL